MSKLVEKTLSLDEVHMLAHRALEGAGARGRQLEQAALAVLEAEADGIRSVGLGYLPIYCEHLKCGKVSGGAEPTHQTVAASAVLSDAARGFSFAAFHEAMDDFHEIAHRNGVAVLAIRNSTSAGVLGWFVERTAKAGLIGLGFANSSALMAPYGGSRAFFGTNPIAFAVPRGDGTPLIADMATSQVAYVTVAGHAERAEPIPLGWGLDAAGRPTTDPAAVLDGGSMAPAGGYKGALLALLVDVLAGGLAGPNFAFQASSFVDNEGGPPDVGQVFLAIAPQPFDAGAATKRDFAGRLEIMLDALAAEEGVRLPGDGRLAARARARRDGIAIAGDLLETIESYF